MARIIFVDACDPAPVLERRRPRPYAWTVLGVVLLVVGLLVLVGRV